MELHRAVVAAVLRDTEAWARDGVICRLKPFKNRHLSLGNFFTVYIFEDSISCVAFE
jgi:hypothetical protein